MVVFILFAYRKEINPEHKAQLWQSLYCLDFSGQKITTAPFGAPMAFSAFLAHIIYTVSSIACSLNYCCLSAIPHLQK